MSDVRIGLDLVPRAVELAARYHARQNRKGTQVPYLVHPLTVAKILARQGYPPEVVAIGILHDVVEDGPENTRIRKEEILEDIRLTFLACGDWMCDRVREVSEPRKKDRTWIQRKRHTIESIPAISEEALAVILADKLDSLRSIREDLEREGERVWERFNAPRGEQEWYYGSLLRAFEARVEGDREAAMLRELREEAGRVFPKVDQKV